MRTSIPVLFTLWVSSAGAQSFEYAISGGGVVRLEAPAPESASSLQELEEIRDALHVPAVTYIAVELDNTAGKTELRLRKLSFVDDSGAQVELEPVSDVARHWVIQTMHGADEQTQATQQRLMDLIHGIETQETALPGARTDVLFAAPVEHIGLVKAFFGEARGIRGIFEFTKK